MTSPIIMIKSLMNQFVSNPEEKFLEQIKNMIYSLETLPPTNKAPKQEEFEIASKYLLK